MDFNKVCGTNVAESSFTDRVSTGSPTRLIPARRLRFHMSSRIFGWGGDRASNRNALKKIGSFSVQNLCQRRTNNAEVNVD